MEPRHIPAEPALLTIGEAAKALGVHVDTLRRWADAGLIQVVVLPSGHRRFRAADIAAQLGAAS